MLQQGLALDNYQVREKKIAYSAKLAKVLLTVALHQELWSSQVLIVRDLIS
jgi:hypothetical protein